MGLHFICLDLHDEVDSFSQQGRMDLGDRVVESVKGFSVQKSISRVS